MVGLLSHLIKINPSSGYWQVKKMVLNMRRTAWFQRKFGVIDDNGILPSIIERLEGTPARLKAKIQGIDESILERKPGGKWSVKEETGHLGGLGNPLVRSN